VVLPVPVLVPVAVPASAVLGPGFKGSASQALTPPCLARVATNEHGTSPLKDQRPLVPPSHVQQKGFRPPPPLLLLLPSLLLLPLPPLPLPCPSPLPPLYRRRRLHLDLHHLCQLGLVGGPGSFLKPRVGVDSCQGPVRKGRPRVGTSHGEKI